MGNSGGAFFNLCQFTCAVMFEVRSISLVGIYMHFCHELLAGAYQYIAEYQIPAVGVDGNLDYVTLLQASHFGVRSVHMDVSLGYD